jgi:hypothetical protein
MKQISVDEIKAIFLMLLNHKHITSTFPKEYLTEKMPVFQTENNVPYANFRIPKQTIQNCLNDILLKSGEEGDTVDLNAAQLLIEEISVASDEFLTFHDLVGLFKVQF